MSEKKIVFSKEVDDTQNGQAIGLSFLTMGLLLQFVPLKYGNNNVVVIIKYIFIVVGILGMVAELQKRKSSIKGIDNVLFGTLVVGVFGLIIYKFENLLILALFGVLFFIGLFAMFLGLQQILYSIFMGYSKKEKRAISAEAYLDLFSKLLGVLLLLAQVAKAAIGINI